MHHQRVLDWGDGPNPLAVGIIVELQLVGKSDGHDVVVDSVEDEEIVIQNVFLDLKSEPDSADDV